LSVNKHLLEAIAVELLPKYNLVLLVDLVSVGSEDIHTWIRETLVGSKLTNNGVTCFDAMYAFSGMADPT